MTRLAVFGFLATLIVAPGIAAETAAPAKPADPNKIVCRTESVTGSRLGQRKRCMTAREWQETARLDRESLERTQRERYPGNEYGSGPMAGHGH